MLFLSAGQRLRSNIHNTKLYHHDTYERCLFTPTESAPITQKFLVLRGRCGEGAVATSPTLKNRTCDRALTLTEILQIARVLKKKQLTILYKLSFTIISST